MRATIVSQSDARQGGRQAGRQAASPREVTLLPSSTHRGGLHALARARAKTKDNQRSEQGVHIVPSAGGIFVVVVVKSRVPYILYTQEERIWCPHSKQNNYVEDTPILLYIRQTVRATFMDLPRITCIR